MGWFTESETEAAERLAKQRAEQEANIKRHTKGGLISDGPAFGRAVDPDSLPINANGGASKKGWWS